LPPLCLLREFIFDFNLKLKAHSLISWLSDRFEILYPRRRLISETSALLPTVRLYLLAAYVLGWLLTHQEAADRFLTHPTGHFLDNSNRVIETVYNGCSKVQVSYAPTI
jgi:hypothetical protein